MKTQHTFCEITRRVWVSVYVANRLKQKNCSRASQDSGVIYANELLTDGHTAARAIEKGIKLGRRIDKAWKSSATLSA